VRNSNIRGVGVLVRIWLLYLKG